MDIQLAQRERAPRTELTQDRVLLELARIAFSDLRAVYDEYGHLLDVNNIPLGTAAAIASWDVDKKNLTAGRGTVEHIRIRFWDKVRALELLAKHLGLLDERVQVTIQHEAMVRRLHAGGNGRGWPRWGCRPRARRRRPRLPKPCASECGRSGAGAPRLPSTPDPRPRGSEVFCGYRETFKPLRPRLVYARSGDSLR